jgi:peroxiredoxin
LQNIYVWLIVGVIAVMAGGYLVLRKMSGPRPSTPATLKAGQPLPEFSGVDDSGSPVSTRDLAGAPAIILFVRGNWCPFCTKQVEGLTQHYKAIIDGGARLILVTPKPLDTTRRVAEFFNVDFEFWLDESLAIARQLGLVHPGGVPQQNHENYGEDTVWPTALVVDADGVIRFSHLSKFIFDRPDPQKLLAELNKI